MTIDHTVSGSARTTGRNRARRALAALLALLGSTLAHAQSVDGSLIATTTHFAFYSDPATNLNDALIAAATARRGKQPELFRQAPEQTCFEQLPRTEQAAWNRAVDYYMDVIAPARFSDRERVVMRLDLAGIAQDSDWSNDDDRRHARIGRAMRAAAASAYQRCRWAEQDARNRAWVDQALRLLETHAQALGKRLVEIYGTPWQGLPFRVDVVETVGSEGANALNLEPPGVHILVASGAQGNRNRAALEILFHEASHFLTGRGSPLRRAIDDAMLARGSTYRGDLVHAALFYITGEAVRRQYAATGERDYTPYIYAQNLYTADFRAQLERALSGYVAGRGTLASAADNLVRAAR